MVVFFAISLILNILLLVLGVSKKLTDVLAARKGGATMDEIGWMLNQYEREIHKEEKKRRDELPMSVFCSGSFLPTGLIVPEPMMASSERSKSSREEHWEAAGDFDPPLTEMISE